MTLNHHIDVAEAYAGNLRLFEATGVGTLLVTDWKKNLHEMFEAGKEVVTYRTPEECVSSWCGIIWITTMRDARSPRLDSSVRYATTLTISERRRS